MEYYKSVIGILIVLAIAFAGYMLYQDHTGSEICIAGEGCSEVRHSNYSEIFGLKVSLFGVLALSGLLVVHFLAFSKKISFKVFLVLVYFGAGFATYFLYLQFVVIGSICPYCVVVDSSILVVFLLANYEYFKLRSK